MGLETGNYIGDLVSTNPTSTDAKSAGDDHFRLIKTVLKECFSGFAGAVIVRATETGTAAAHVLTPTPALVGYVTGMMLLYRPVNAGTGALTVNVSALGAKSVKLINGADPTSGDVVVNQPLLLMYDGTNFVCLGGSPYLMKTGDQTITGNTTVTGTLTVSGATTFTGDIGGTGGDKKANLASPTFTGTPAAPTAALGTNTTQIATMAALFNQAMSTVLPGIALGFLSSSDGTTATFGKSISGWALNEGHGADIASSGTINLTTATGNLVDVTGTTTITAITLAEGAERTVRFTGILTLTHGVSLVLPGAASITTAAGDFAVFRGYAAGVVRCVVYTKTSGAAVVTTPPTAALGASMVLLSTVTASGAGSADIETTFDATYDNYVIVASGVQTSVDTTALIATLKIGGSYQSANYRYRGEASSDASSTYAGFNSASASTIIMMPGANVSNAASASIDFELRVSNPASTALTKKIRWSAESIGSSAALYHIAGAGAYSGSNSALTGIRIAFNGGGNTTGTFRLYGIKNS